MEVKIGVQNVTRELLIDTALDAEEVQEAVAKSIADGSVLALADARGRRILIPAEKLAYVDITTSVAGQVGFRS